MVFRCLLAYSDTLHHSPRVVAEFFVHADVAVTDLFRATGFFLLFLPKCIPSTDVMCVASSSNSLLVHIFCHTVISIRSQIILSLILQKPRALCIYSMLLLLFFPFFPIRTFSNPPFDRVPCPQTRPVNWYNSQPAFFDDFFCMLPQNAHALPCMYMRLN